MSLILEALKKSEAERRLGQSPGLLDASPYARRRRRSPWLLVASIGALLAAVAIAAFWLGQQERPTEPNPVLSKDTAPASDAAQPSPSADVAADSTPRPLAPGTPPAASGPALVSAPAARTPSDPGFASVEREERPHLPSALPHAVPAPQPAPAPPPPPIASSAVEAAPPALIPAAPPSPPTAPGSSTEPATPAPPPLSSLGAERRGRLPPLKVSMHVYAEVPSDRVALIDGRRLREGDEISPGLRLVEIRRDGSVLEVEGQRFLLPRS